MNDKLEELVNIIFPITFIVALVVLIYAIVAGIWGFNPFLIEVFNLKLAITACVTMLVIVIIIALIDV